MRHEGITHAIRERTAAVVLVTALAFSGAVELANVPEADALAPTTAVVRNECVNPTKEDIRDVKHLLDQPEANIYHFKGEDAHYGKGGVPPEEVKKQKQFFKQEARKRGLTIFDWSDRLGPLYQRMGNEIGGSYEPFLIEAKSFMTNFGVSVDVGTPDMSFAYGGRAPSDGELRSLNAKNAMVDIIQAFTNVPKEYVQLTGLKHIIITTGTEDQNVAGYAETGDQHDTFFIDISKYSGAIFSEHDIMHETYHLLDSEQCGPAEMMNDPTFAALNKGSNIYSNQTYNENVPSLQDTYYSELTKVGPGLYEALAAKNVPIFCSITQDLREKAKQVLSYSTYHTNPAEDKAELGAAITSFYEYVDLADPRFGIVHNKFVFLLARLYHQNPKLVEYFTAVTQRPQHSKLEKKC